MAEESRKLAEGAARQTDPKIRVLVDARKLGDGGIGTYIEHLILGLVAQPDIVPSLIIRSLNLLDRFPWLNDFELIVDDAKSYSLDELFGMSKRIPFNNYDIFHSPHFTLPYNIPIPSVVTIHDTIHISHPESFYYPQVAKWYIKSACKRASRVVTVSASSAEAIRSVVGGNGKIAKKIRVVPCALNPYFAKQIQADDFLTKRFKLDSPYVLSVVSQLKPHKGIKDLLAAFKSFKENCHHHKNKKICKEVKLVLVGIGAEKMVEQSDYLREAGEINDLYVFGKVSDEELHNLYTGAQALIVPSFAEGFCLPALEAHAQGTPVLARPVPAVLELLGEYDVECKDFRISSLESGLRAVLASTCSESKVDASEQIRTEALKYKRDEIARTMSVLYQEVADQKSASES